MNKIYIDSSVKKANVRELREFTQDEIKNEPMLFNCNYESALKLGGVITREALAILEGSHDYHNVLASCVIDTRVHMLMEGWYPCIPGWHHDDVPRERGDGQPNYLNPSYKSEHLMLLVNGNICPTTFAFGGCNLTIPNEGIIYEQWNNDVDVLIENGVLSKVPVETNKWYYFNYHSFHKGVPAVRNGWRYFIRISWNTKRKPTNEIRRQVQVYLDIVNKGW